MYNSLFLEQQSREQKQETFDWSQWKFIKRTVCTTAHIMSSLRNTLGPTGSN